MSHYVFKKNEIVKIENLLMKIFPDLLFNEKEASPDYCDEHQREIVGDTIREYIQELQGESAIKTLGFDTDKFCKPCLIASIDWNKVESTPIDYNPMAVQ